MKTIRTKTLGAFHARTDRDAAFTRLELFACVVCVALVGAFALPVLATTRSQSDTAQCFNNLRQIGCAVRSWGSDHQDQIPWRIFVSQGGTRPDTGTKPGNAWFEFAFISNQLNTPLILACPADMGVLAARNFSEYNSAAFRANATSYSISMHPLSESPASIVCADRNMQFLGTGSCAYGVSTVSLFDPYFGTDGWTNSVHGLQGHILRMDGSVIETSTTELRQAVAISEGGPSDLIVRAHFLKAR